MPSPSDCKWNERSSDSGTLPVANDSLFRLFFEGSLDAIWLFDPEARVFVDCNQATLDLIRCSTKEQLLRAGPLELSSTFQMDGRASTEKATEIADLVSQHGGHRFEWMLRRFDGEEVPVEVMVVISRAGERRLYVVIARDISERKRADAALRASERKFRRLFETSYDAILLQDAKTAAVLDCNPAAVLMRGCATKEELLQLRPVDFSPEFQPDGHSSLEKTAEVLAAVQAKGGHSFEWMARRQNGELFETEATVTLVQMDDQQILVTISRDITERKRTEAAWRENQQLLASITANVAEGIYRRSPEHGVIFVNAAFLKMFGCDTIEDVKRAPRESFYGRTHDCVQLHAMLNREGSFRNQEVEFVRRDGSHFWGLFSASRVVDPETQATTFHDGVIIDITEQKRAADEIRRLNQTLEHRIAERTAELTASEARLRTLVEHAPEAIVVFDCDTGKFTIVNENAVRLFGLDREALLQIGPAEISPPVQPDGRTSKELASELIQAALNGATPSFEWLLRHASGRLIPCEIRLVRLPAEGRRLVRGSITDNTEGQRKEKIQSAIFQISEAVHTADDLDNLYEQIHGIIKGLMPADNFYIAIYDAKTELLSFDYFVDEKDTRPAPMKLSAGLTGYVLRTGKAFLANQHNIVRYQQTGTAAVFDAGQEIVYAERGTPAVIWLGAPLVIQGKPIGVMAVQDYRDESAYGEVEKQILMFVAAQTALAIERKRTQEALRESEQKFRALFEASSQGVMLHDEEQFLEINPATLRILGYSRADEIIGKHPSQTSPPIQPNGQSSAALARQHIAECMAKGSARFDWMARSAQGADIPLEVILTRVEMDGRRLIQAVINDISERKIAEAILRDSEARLRESEARFSTAFHASPVLISIVRMSDGRFVELNEAFLSWLGCRRDEAVGRNSADLALWVDPEERNSFWAELHLRRGIRNHEAQVRNARGAIHTMWLSADEIEISHETHALIVGLDITERKKAEAELLKTLAREKELSQLKSNFVSMVSHEFRTPLGVIMSSAEILESYFDQLDPVERRQHLRSIQKNTRRTSELMEEVLVLGMVEAGKMEFKPAPLDLHSFCRRAMDELLSATEHQCSIIFATRSIPSDVLADERLLRHIFTNLLSNAVKYSPPGSTVHFEIEAHGEQAICLIRDEGCGIPESDLEWLFQAFHRGRNVGKVPGTGLGLVIVKRCVELHGGKIKIESSVGQGTIVTVTLPLFGKA